MVTLRDIAKAAGVSPMTVSNVLNERPHVSAATREKVLSTMTALDYRVNVAARNLRTGRTHTIGLAVPEVDRPYFGQLAAAVIDRGKEHGLHVVVEQTGASREIELSAIAMSRVRMYDGLILSTVGLGETDVDRFRVDFPVVLLGERIFHGPVDHLAMPNAAGTQAAVEHLIARGCRRIAGVFGPLGRLGLPGAEPDVNVLRYAGFDSALQAAGLAVDPGLVISIDELDLDHGRRAVRELLDRPLGFDGVFCVTDYVAIGVMRGLADAGVRVPDEIKVIGYDDIDVDRFTVPSLSTVSPDHELMATTAVELLVSRMRGDVRDPVEFTAPFTIQERESTALRARRPRGRGAVTSARTG